jgi:hypothetical protein
MNHAICNAITTLQLLRLSCFGWNRVASRTLTG